MASRQRASHTALRQNGGAEYFDIIKKCTKAHTREGASNDSGVLKKVTLLLAFFVTASSEPSGIRYSHNSVSYSCRPIAWIQACL